MHEDGYRRTKDQCRDKINNLKKDYRALDQETRRIKATSLMNFPDFEALDSVLGECAPVSPKCVYGTSECLLLKYSASTPPPLFEVPGYPEENYQSATYSSESSQRVTQYNSSSGHTGSQTATNSTSSYSTGQESAGRAYVPDPRPRIRKGRSQRKRCFEDESSDGFSKVAKNLTDMNAKLVDFMLKMEDADTKREE